jgi:hypothetical protein
MKHLPCFGRRHYVERHTLDTHRPSKEGLQPMRAGRKTSTPQSDLTRSRFATVRWGTDRSCRDRGLTNRGERRTRLVGWHGW